MNTTAHGEQVSADKLVGCVALECNNSPDGARDALASSLEC